MTIKFRKAAAHKPAKVDVPIVKDEEERTPSFNPIELLPFVKNGEGSRGFHRIFWAVESTGDFSMDTEKGAAMADLAIRYAAENGFPGLIGWCVQDMIARGKYEGLEIGFMGRLATVAIWYARSAGSR
jgi:hypothetical protein